MEKNKNLSRKIQLFFVILWISFLCSFIVFKLTYSFFGLPQFKPFPVYENRLVNTFPKLSSLSTKEYGSGIEKWYNDNFAFRTDIINFYRNIHYFVLKSSFGREVPGVGNWFFRHGGDWAELDDYLGAIVLTEEQIDELVTLFEGKVEWARAHGSEFIQVITPVKAQMHPEKLPYVVRCHKGRGVSEQMKEALENSLAKDNVLFLDNVISKAVKEKNDVFYFEDHHLNAYGTYLLYLELNRYLATRFDNIGLMDFYEKPPQEVLDGTVAGCYEINRRLEISRPGDKELCDKYIYETRRNLPFPMTNVGTITEDEGISIAMAHDSTMRFALASWTDTSPENLHFPFGDGIQTIRAYIFTTFTTGLMAFIMNEDVPDVFIEQFAECKLNQKVGHVNLDVLNAAKFFNGTALSNDDVIKIGDELVVRVIFDNISYEGYIPVGKEMKELSIFLFNEEEKIAQGITYPGIKRAVYFSIPVTELVDFKKINVVLGDKIICDKIQLAIKRVDKNNFKD